MNFDSKIAVVIREDLLAWQKLNVTAFTISGIASLPDVIGENYIAPLSHLTCLPHLCYNGFRT